MKDWSKFYEADAVDVRTWKDKLRSSISRLMSRLITYEGESVVIDWIDEDNDWPTFKLLNFEREKHRVILLPERDLDGEGGDGDSEEFWCAIADIAEIWLRSDVEKQSKKV